MSVVCQHFQRSLCTLGDRCRNLHPQTVCQNELILRGSCTRGDDCPFSHNSDDLKKAIPKRPHPEGGGSSTPNNLTAICRYYQEGRCSRGLDCSFNHPHIPCKKVLRGGSANCSRGARCTHSHNPLTIEANRPRDENMWLRTGNDSCQMASSMSPVKVCHTYQQGRCNYGVKCSNAHPTFPCQKELQKRGSCPNKVSCKQSHNHYILDAFKTSPKVNQPTAMLSDSVTLKGCNLFWLKANKSVLYRKLNKRADSLKTWDELGGMAKTYGVELDSDFTRDSSSSMENQSSQKIIIRGFSEKVDELKKLLEKQDRLLNNFQKYEERLIFADAPWVEHLWQTNRKKFESVLTSEGTNALAWWDIVHPTDDGRGDTAAALSNDPKSMTMLLASAKIDKMELNVGFTTNIASAVADALIISCGPYMTLEDGVAQEICDWFAPIREQASAAKCSKFGHGPLPECEFVPVHPPPDQQESARTPLIICTYIPMAGNDDDLNVAKMQKAIGKALQYIVEYNQISDKDMIKTVAMPLLGTGRFGYAPRTAAKAVLEEVICKASSYGLTRLNLLDQRVEQLEAMKSEIQQRVSGCGSVFNLTELPVMEVHQPGWYYFVGKVEGGNSQNHDMAMQSTKNPKHCITKPNGTWFPLMEDVMGKVEEAFQLYTAGNSQPNDVVATDGAAELPPGKMSFIVDNPKYLDGVEYEVRFDCSPMKQKNTRTGFERTVMRHEKSLSLKRPDFEAIKRTLDQNSNQVRKHVSDKVIGISYLALDKNSAKDAIYAVQSRLKEMFDVQKVCIPLPEHVLSTDEEIRVRSMLTSCKVAVEVKVNGGISTVINLTGLPGHVDMAKQKVLQSPLYQLNSTYAFPDTWNSTESSRNVLVEVGLSSAEYHEVAAKFYRGFSSAEIVTVQRVENVLLYKAYQGNARTLRERYSVNGRCILKPEQLVKELWHGTSKTSPEAVVLSSSGIGRVQTSMWGPGNYFSTTSAYVGKHSAHELSDGSKQMILFEVMTGLECELPPQESLKKPPPVQSDHWVMDLFGQGNAPPNLTFDSVTGLTDGTRVYITYSTGVAQQYPHYIVTYKTS